MGANFLLVGAMDVLLVVLSIRLLKLGSPGVGYLTAAFGMGALVGAIVATVLTGRRHLAPVLLTGTLAWAAGLALIGAMPSRAAALLLIVVAGTGKPLIDVVGRILLQRVVANRVLSRVFGVLEGLSMAAQALGMLLVPLLVSLLSAQGAFVVFGAVLPLLTLVLWRGLQRIDATHIAAEERLPLLRSLAIFAPLSASIQLRLAARLVPVTVAAGSVIVREGDRGDRFYIILTGQVSVSIGENQVAALGQHDFFGEIALLHNIPRTASVTAQSETSLYALDRDDFLEALTGHTQSMDAARAVSRARLGETA
jgi:MFS family permease